MPDSEGYLTDDEIMLNGVAWEIHEQGDADWLCEAWIGEETECPNVAIVELKHHEYNDSDWYCSTLALCQWCLNEMMERERKQ